MNQLSTNKLNRVRLRFFDLGKSFFAGRPDAEIMGRWRGIVTALEKESISPAIDQAIRFLSQMLAEMNLEELQQEYYTLFDDPFSRQSVELTASGYIDGRSYGQTLVVFREFLKQAEIGRFNGVTASEDSLVLMLDVMVTLIEENRKQGQENAELQKKLLTEFLFPLCTHLKEQLHENVTARYYSGCADFLVAYLELEKSLLISE